MAMVGVSETEVKVRCRWLDGRPMSIDLGDEELPVLAIDGVREETAAYRVDRGPRTVFEVRTPDARLRLAFEHRRRRWVLEALDRQLPVPGRLAAAA